MKHNLVIAANCWIALGILIDLSALVLETKRSRNKGGASGIPFLVTLLVFYIPGAQLRNISLQAGPQLLLWLLLFNVLSHFILPIGISMIFPGKEPPKSAMPEIPR